VWGSDANPELAEKLAEVKRHLIAYAVCFALLFSVVLFLFWWSRTAVDFSAARVTASNVPTYRVLGVVRNARTGDPVPWAKIQDDASGTPPFFDTDGNADGTYALLTVPLVHQIRISAQGYRPVTVNVGRHWFQWWPRGEEKVDVNLLPE
jgi:hypothetical protein